MKDSELLARACRRRETIARKRYASKVEMTPQEVRDAVDKIARPKSMFGHPTDTEGNAVGKAGRTMRLIEKWREQKPIPVGEQFRDFIRRELSKANYIWGHEEAISDTAIDISYNYGFDPLDVVYTHYKVAEQDTKTVNAASVYGPVEFPSKDKVYATPDEHSRYCPEHPGIQMRRKSDNVYHCPIGKEGYSYTDEGGHEVKFETGVHQQISPSMNASRPKAPFLSEKPDLEIVEKEAYDFEKLHGFQYKPKMGQECPEMRVTVPDDAEQVTNKNKSKGKKASLTRVAQKVETDTTSNLFGPVQNKTRFCPDHADVQTTRIADSVYQCPIDGVIYDWNMGFKKKDGAEVPGGSVANMTPDVPGYYSSPHVI